MHYLIVPIFLDGKWGSWSGYNEMTIQGKISGIKKRSRICNNPVGGKYCIGQSEEQQMSYGKISIFLCNCN